MWNPQESSTFTPLIPDGPCDIRIISAYPEEIGSEPEIFKVLKVNFETLTDFERGNDSFFLNESKFTKEGQEDQNRKRLREFALCTMTATDIAKANEDGLPDKDIFSEEVLQYIAEKITGQCVNVLIKNKNGWPKIGSKFKRFKGEVPAKAEPEAGSDLPF